MINKKLLLWLNIIYTILLFLIVIIGNLPTGFMFFLLSIWLVWPSYATAMALRSNKSFLTAKWLLMYNVLFLVIVIGFSIWIAIDGHPQAFLLTSPFLIIPTINCFALIKNPAHFS